LRGTQHTTVRLVKGTQRRRPPADETTATVVAAEPERENFKSPACIRVCASVCQARETTATTTPPPKLLRPLGLSGAGPTSKYNYTTWRWRRRRRRWEARTRAVRLVPPRVGLNFLRWRQASRRHRLDAPECAAAARPLRPSLLSSSSTCACPYTRPVRGTARCLIRERPIHYAGPATEKPRYVTPPPPTTTMTTPVVALCPTWLWRRCVFTSVRARTQMNTRPSCSSFDYPSIPFRPFQMPYRF